MEPLAPPAKVASFDPSAPAPIRKEVLRDKIAELLRGWILDGTVKPGERIVELTVARHLHVSRAPLREALFLLARQGMVEIRSHQGAVVTRLSERDIREIFEMRELLEIHAAKRARVRARRDPTVAETLEGALQGLEAAAGRRDMAGFSKADFAFHKTLWEQSGNRRLCETLEEVSARYFGYAFIRDLPLAASYEFDEVVREHRNMVRWILEGSDRDIERGFRRAFEKFRDYVLERYAEREAALA